MRDTVITVQKQQKSMQDWLGDIEKTLLDHLQNKLPLPSMSLPPVNMLTTVTTPTHANGQFIKSTLSDMTNHPTNQSFDSQSNSTTFPETSHNFTYKSTT